MKSPLFSFSEQTSRPVRAHGGELRLKSRALKVSLGSNGGLVWNFPVRVAYTPDNGSEQSIPVIDQTRLAQIGLFLLAALLAAILAAWVRPRSQ